MSKSYWDERARKFKTTGFSDFSVAFFDQRMRLLCVERLFAEEQQQGGLAHNNLLDFGCGSGDFLAHFSSSFNKLVGYDTSKEILAVAKEKLHDAPNVALTTTLDKQQLTFDIVLSITVLQHILDDSELASTLRTLYRLMAPYGTMVALEAVTAVGLDYTFPSYVKTRSVDRWKQLFQEAGFHVKVERAFYNPVLFPTPLYRDYRRRIRFSGPLYRVLCKLFGNVRILNARFQSAAQVTLPSAEVADGFLSGESVSQFFVLKKARQ